MHVAVVTGAAQGIGKRTAELLARAGYTLVLADIKVPATTRGCIERNGGQALEAVGDLGDPDFVSSLAGTVKERFGRIDVLVNNAGISHIGPATQTSVTDLKRVLDINLIAPFLLAQVFGRVMLEQRSGAIVNIASIAGIAAIAERAAYNASKHGLIGLTRTLAAEWGGYGVRCNAVCPGWVKTEMDAADQSTGNYRDSDIIDRVPMARFAAPDDIAQAVVFLSDATKSGFINGQTIVVDGGWTCDASWETLRLAQRP